MKKLVVFGLIAAIGAVTFINRAQAQNSTDVCAFNPMQCNGTVPDSVLNGGQQPHNGVPQAPRSNGADNGQNDWRHHHRGQRGYYRPGYSAFGYPGYGYQNFGYPGYGYYDNQPNVYLNFSLGTPDYRNRCSDLAFRLRNRGFYNVRPIRCGGSTYIYAARRDGERLRVYVSAYSGRIRDAVPF